MGQLWAMVGRVPSCKAKHSAMSASIGIVAVAGQSRRACSARTDFLGLSQYVPIPTNVPKAAWDGAKACRDSSTSRPVVGSKIARGTASIRFSFWWKEGVRCFVLF